MANYDIVFMLLLMALKFGVFVEKYGRIRKFLLAVWRDKSMSNVRSQCFNKEILI